MNAQPPREFIDRRQLLSALRAFRRGDFTVRMSEDSDDIDHEIAVLFNEVVGLNQQITEEFERLSQVVGKEGKIGQRGRVRGATGGWETKLRAVNELIEDMVQPTAEVARVLGTDLERGLLDLVVLDESFRLRPSPSTTGPATTGPSTRGRSIRIRACP